MFVLRDNLKWKGKPFKEDKPFDSYLPATQRGKELFDCYQLNRFSQKLSKEYLNETLGTLDLLDRVSLENLPVVQSGLDVGSKNWSYLPAIDVWLEKKINQNKDPIPFYGVEIDSYRIYQNLTTRYAVAQYFCKQLSNQKINYHFLPQDIRMFFKRVSLITWFLPFVHLDTHLSWGLPKNLFYPKEVFNHVVNCLEIGGNLILANQTESEWEVSEAILSEKLKLINVQEVTNSLHPSAYPIFLSLWTRESISP